jgi:antitoxin component YwqK of YwqJK toxin-antitoxin module
MQDGLSCDWYVSGKIKSEASYFRNLLHGRSREFSEDSSLRSEKEYEYGVLVRSSVLDEFGNVVERCDLPEGSPNFPLLQRLRNQFGA